jgi:GNAT superfamily N-acetyltransferase
MGSILARAFSEAPRSGLPRAIAAMTIRGVRKITGHIASRATGDLKAQGLKDPSISPRWNQDPHSTRRLKRGSDGWHKSVMTNLQTFIVKPGTPELAICARWRADAFSTLQASFEDELRSLELFASDQSHGVGLVAKADGEPIGTCLLVESEIEPNHDVSPWLAGLFVVPEHRRQGAGAVLVRAIEDQARERGFSRLYLYTRDAVGFYLRLGWSVHDHTDWKGQQTAFMVRDL